MKTYLIRQNIRLLINEYRILEQAADGSTNLVGFAQQKRFAFREKFTLYGDESKVSVLVEVQARQVIDLGARYDVKDSAGTVLGVIGKSFRASLLRSTWHIYQTGNEATPKLVVSERSQALALTRRIWELLPYINDIPFFVKYHFDFVDPSSGTTAASLEKTTLFKDHYKLDVHEDASDMDWRVFVAMGVMLDALQSR